MNTPDFPIVGSKNKGDFQSLEKSERTFPIIGKPEKLSKGWRWVKLGEVCIVNPPRPTMDRTPEQPTTFIPMEAVDAQSGRVTAARLRPYGEVQKGYTYFAEGDVLFAKITPCMQNGKHAIATALLDGIGFGTTEFHVIRPGPYMTPEWIHSFLRQPSLLQKATEHFTGAVGQQRLPPDYLKSLEIPLPPLAEQKRIAAILNEQMTAVERARKAAEERLAAVKALPSAFLRKVFPEHGQSLSEGWRWVKLGEITKTCSGTTPSRSRSDYYGGTIPWVKTAELKNGTIEKTEENVSELAMKETSLPLLPPGTLLIAMYGQGQTRGRTGLLKCRATTNQACFAILPNPLEFEPEFLQMWFIFSYEWIREQSEFRGGNQPNLNGEILKSLSLPLPPLSEQRRIAALLNEQMAVVERARKAAAEELAAIEALPAALLRQAFAGEL